MTNAKDHPQNAPANVSSPPGVRGSMFRATGDFHSRPVSWVDGLGEHLFVLGNLSSLLRTYRTYADSDILDLGPDSFSSGRLLVRLSVTPYFVEVKEEKGGVVHVVLAARIASPIQLASRATRTSRNS